MVFFYFLPSFLLICHAFSLFLLPRSTFCLFLPPLFVSFYLFYGGTDSISEEMKTTWIGTIKASIDIITEAEKGELLLLLLMMIAMIVRIIMIMMLLMMIVMIVSIIMIMMLLMIIIMMVINNAGYIMIFFYFCWGIIFLYNI